MGSEQRYYCYLDSNGQRETNLQLFSLRRAIKEWEILQSKHDILSPDEAMERNVFIVATLGLSLSQLLGQNFSTGGNDTPELHVLFSSFLNTVVQDSMEKNRLSHSFREMNLYYNSCRHFGPIKYQEINLLNSQK